LALNCVSYLALKLAFDSRVLALVLVSRVQASTLALRGPGLGLGVGLESLGLGLEDPGLGLVLGLWILALTTTLIVNLSPKRDTAIPIITSLHLRNK